MSLPAPNPGSVALVTGASSGIGEEFARREERLVTLCEELGGPERAIAIAADPPYRKIGTAWPSGSTSSASTSRPWST